MATHYNHYRSGQLYGIFYTFDLPGDGIPTHAHDNDLSHNIVVLKGCVELRIDGETILIPAGSVFDFDWTKRHEVLAAEPNTQVLHLMLNGMPAGYDKLPDSELRGNLQYRGMH